MDRVFTDNQVEIVEYDLNKIDEKETVEVNLKDLMYVIELYKSTCDSFINLCIILNWAMLKTS